MVLLPAPMALYIRGMPHRVLHTPYLSHIPYTVSNNNSNNKGESFFGKREATQLHIIHIIVHTHEQTGE